MRDRFSPTFVVLGIAATWAAVVVVQTGLASGDWLTVIRQAVGLIAAAGLLGHLAAAFDNMVDDMQPGSGGKRGGRFQPVRIRPRSEAASRPPSRRTPPTS